MYALLIFLFSLVFFLWMDYYLAFTSDVSFTIITFLLSISGSIFCFSCLACCCLIRNNSPKVLSYMVTTTTMSVLTAPHLTVLSLQYGVSIGSVLFVELVSVIITFVYRHSLSQALQEGIFLSMERFETRASNDGRHGGSQSQRRPLLGPSHG